MRGSKIPIPKPRSKATKVNVIASTGVDENQFTDTLPDLTTTYYYEIFAYDSAAAGGAAGGAGGDDCGDGGGFRGCGFGEAGLT